MFRYRLISPILVALALACTPAPSNASTIGLEGSVLVVRGAPGETNVFYVSPADEQGYVAISDTSAPTPDPSAQCTSDYYNSFTCPVPGGGVRVEGGDGNDQLTAADKLPAGMAVTLDGGADDDVLRGPAFTKMADTLTGGDGNDKVHGGLGADAIDGGAGDDEIDDLGGGDVIHAGAGNDTILPDYWQEQSTDVVDGGPGFDQIKMNWQSEYGKYQPPIDVSIDGVANDGRPDESDNVTDVEYLYFTAPATLTGSDGPDQFETFNSDGPSKYFGRGGDDKIKAFDLDDTIDGGAGSDTLEGGYGNDTITGGPGRDVINGDATGALCGYTQCRNAYGNDTIDARDGEADVVTCGVGTDTVEADASDSVASDCETVHRGGTTTVDDGKDHVDNPPPPPPARATLSGLRVRRAGRMITVTGRATGAQKVTARVLRGKRTLASRSTAVRNGRFSVRLRAPRNVRVSVAAGAAKRTLAVR